MLTARFEPFHYFKESDHLSNDPHEYRMFGELDDHRRAIAVAVSRHPGCCVLIPRYVYDNIPNIHHEILFPGFSPLFNGYEHRHGALEFLTSTDNPRLEPIQHLAVMSCCG